MLFLTLHRTTREIAIVGGGSFIGGEKTSWDDKIRKINNPARSGLDCTRKSHRLATSGLKFEGRQRLGQVDRSLSSATFGRDQHRVGFDEAALTLDSTR